MKKKILPLILIVGVLIVLTKVDVKKTSITDEYVYHSAGHSIPVGGLVARSEMDLTKRFSTGGNVYRNVICDGRAGYDDHTVLYVYLFPSTETFSWSSDQWNNWYNSHILSDSMAGANYEYHAPGGDTIVYVEHNEGTANNILPSILYVCYNYVESSSGAWGYSIAGYAFSGGNVNVPVIHIEGYVTDSCNNNLLSGVHVYQTGYEGVYTDNTGYYSLDLEQGVVHFSKLPFYSTYNIHGVITEENQDIALTPSAGCPESCNSNNDCTPGLSCCGGVCIELVCAGDVYECPDGSFVGRGGCNCEFSPCPEEPECYNPGDCLAGERTCSGNKVWDRTYPCVDGQCDYTQTTGSLMVENCGDDACVDGVCVPPECPIDTLNCLDGTILVRQPPSCEFGVCPYFALDPNSDGIVSRIELNTGVNLWKMNTVTRNDLGKAIVAWVEKGEE